MKNIHILPTDKPSSLFFIDKNLFYLPEEKDRTNWKKELVNTQNSYITNDEKLKEGDWFIRDGSIHKCFRVHKTDIEFLTLIDSVYCGSNTFWNKEFCKKIILTTDQDLIKDGVQAIPDEFLEWYIKNPSCEEVEVGSSFHMFSYKNSITNYKIIIPKEEPKQETLEEAKIEYHFENDIEMFEFMNEMASTGKIPKKWSLFVSKINDLYRQQERMYSEEEVYNIVEQAIKDNSSKQLHFFDGGYFNPIYTNLKKWFEQFKKK